MILLIEERRQLFVGAHVLMLGGHHTLCEELLVREEFFIVMLFDTRVVQVSQLSHRLNTSKLRCFLISIEGCDHILVHRESVFINVTHEVLRILDVLVPAQSKSEPIRTLEVVVALVILTLCLFSQFEMQVSSVDHGRTEP